MVLVFSCSREAKRALDELMERGGYTDYSDVINAAVTNFAVLSSELEGKGAFVFPGREPVDVVGVETQTKPIKKGSRSSEHGPDLPPQVGIPSLFSRSVLPDQPPVALAPVVTHELEPGEVVPVDRWIWGQYSKILPVKASCRALSQLLLADDSGFHVEKIAGQIAQEAAGLRAYLKGLDVRYGLTRDDALSTGFPDAGDNGDRSRLRFASQFVGAISKQGQLSGLLADYRLIGLTGERARRVQLTEAGWAFSLLPNPVLDGTQARPGDRLSDEERVFLIEHVVRCVPAEDFAFRTMLAAISQGLVTPEMLQTAVKKMPVANSEGISDAFVTTQRSGVISRMADLGLVTRVREGVRVSYVITQDGNAYAARTLAA